MAAVSRWIIFWRAFLVTLLFGSSVSPTGAQTNQTDEADWLLAQKSCSAEGFRWYLRRNPAGQHLAEAVTMLTTLGVRGAASAAVECEPVTVPAAPSAVLSAGSGGSLY
ncbi:hypothetical protein OEW28_08735 [Defluviimonas sp. WL0002]|uniref:Uncharacterized protein n=1 Tax=Albidovulum marisflavi TaxID=2984159 RepID=A0ABT2ZCA5_9RHOB|nr:hypothetical protein [Defluviimonas sp. WL0002]MCV2868713.1 hypothetical protein [Defluviimonas sp. WL0002]